MILTTLSDETFRAEFERRFPSLSLPFVQGMSEIGNYGLEKYGDNSVEAKFRQGDFSRSERTKTREILRHAFVHGEEFTDGILHDKFGTPEHQLFAGAFNFMMEFRFRSKK